MILRAWGIMCLLALASQAQAATLAQVNDSLRDVELQLLILDVQSVGARARLTNQQFELDRQIQLIQAAGTLDQQIVALQVVVGILTKHQEIITTLDQADYHRTDVACHYDAALFHRDAGDYAAAMDCLASAKQSAILSSDLYTEANRLLGITQVYIAELRGKIAAF